MRKTCIAIVLTVIGLSALNGSASATPLTGKVRPYVELGHGTIVSTVQNVTTSTGKVVGIPIRRGTTSGSEVASSSPPPCGPNAGSPVTGSVTTTASNGNELNTSLNGTVCKSASTSSYTRYLLTATVTITGGTGRFTDATGGGKLYSTVTLYPNSGGSQGPFTSLVIGAIRLAR